MAATESIGADLDATDLRGKVRSGVGWKMIQVGFGQGAGVLISIVLAHLLTPSDFGLAGFALVFSGLAYALTDVGLGAALVRRKTITEEDRSTAFWVTAAAGMALMIGGIAISPLLAWFFSEPEVIPLFSVLSISFLFSSLGQTQTALLTREMSFRSLELRNIAATIVGAVFALLFALAGFGPWAIIAQVVFTSVASTVFLWTVSPWRPRLIFSGERFRTLGSFGVKTLGMRMSGWVNTNVDNLLVGRALGSAALGIYAVAYNIMYLPSSYIIAPLVDVLYAAFSRLHDNPRRLGDLWLRINNVAGSVLVPAYLGLAAVSPEFIPAVLGPKWDAAIPVLQLLSVGGALGSLQAFNGQVYQALGRPGLFLRFLCFATVVTLIAFVIGLEWGIVGVAGSYAVSRAIMLIANSVEMSRLMDFNLWRMLRSYLAVAGRAAAMGAVVFMGHLALVHLGVPLGARLVILVVGGAVFYLLLMLLVAPDLVRDARNGLLRRRLPTTE